MIQFTNLVKRLGQSHPLIVVVVASLLARVLDIVSVLLERLGPTFTFGGPEELISKMGITGAIFVVVFVGPALETVVFQALPILALKMFTRLSPIWIIGLTAVPFGVSHAIYSLPYMVGAACMGLLLSTIYLSRLYGNGSAFFLTFCVHAINNAVDLR